MTKIARFGTGGLGGLLPVLASLLAVDLTAIAAIVDHYETVSIGLCVGYGLRVAILFTLGGVMAVLNSEIQNPLALVQIGIAAPALVTSFVSGAALSQTQKPFRQAISFLSTAHAAEVDSDGGTKMSGFLNDVISGLTPGLGVQPPRRLTGPEIIAAFVGNTVYTPGRYGPKTNVIHYAADGTIKLAWPEGSDTGMYKVSGDGEFCTKYKIIRGGGEFCQTIYQTGPDAYEFHFKNGVILKAFVAPGIVQ